MVLGRDVERSAGRMVSMGAGARVVVVVTMLSVVENDSGDIEEVVAGLCLRRTSVTLKIAS